jgi:hypothetical protein
MSWFFLALIIPIIVAWLNGSTYTFASSVLVIGVLLYFINIFLIRYFIQKRAPSILEDDSWEMTAGPGIVPKWVSALGIVGLGFIPSGLVVALLLWLGVVANKAL